MLAFQRLWNRNHPEAPIDEDGAWGPMTEGALAASPADGFAIGAVCDDGHVPPIGDVGAFDPVDPADPGAADGGCAAGGDAGGGAAVLLALAALAARPRLPRARVR